MTAAQPGQVIADRYQLEAPLGRGGMGRIWRAHHLRLNSKVALKFLDPSIVESQEAFNRFMLEGQAAAAVRSAHVVQVFDCGVDGVTPYISMELLRGEGLDQRLASRAKLDPAELDKVFSEVARAVDNSHERGVIHRDLKPANIFIAREGEREITKVLDFGIAKVTSRGIELDSAALTSTGTMLGTPHYMSPEQVRGSRSVDHRADLWALAVVAFECLTGKLPFEGGSTGDVIVQICTEEPPLPSATCDVPPGFDAWFLKGIHKDPGERFASARQMAEALSRILAPSLAPPGQVGGFRAAPIPEPTTLRSEPGQSSVEPASTPPPVTRTPTVVLRRGRSRWLWLVPVSSFCGVVVTWWFAGRAPFRDDTTTNTASSGATSSPVQAPASSTPAAVPDPVANAKEEPDLTTAAPAAPAAAAEAPIPAPAPHEQKPTKAQDVSAPQPAAPKSKAAAASPRPRHRIPPTKPAEPEASAPPVTTPEPAPPEPAPPQPAADESEREDLDPFSERH